MIQRLAKLDRDTVKSILQVARVDMMDRNR
jgi:hypothetical protein